MTGTMKRPSKFELTSRRQGFGLAGLLLGLLLVGTAATGGWFAARHVSREHQVREGAAILAEHGLREFAANTSTLELMALGIGGDSIVHTARVFADEVSSGMVAVQITRAADATFHVKSTGRLDSGGTPFVCSYDVIWEVDREADPRRALDPQDGPLCNGARRRRPADTGGELLQRLNR
jgi:hypothetical protein